MVVLNEKDTKILKKLLRRCVTEDQVHDIPGSIDVLNKIGVNKIRYGNT